MKNQIIAVIFGFILFLLANVSFAQSGNYKQQFGKAVNEKVCSNFSTAKLASMGNYKQSAKVNTFSETASFCCDDASCLLSGCCGNGTCAKGCCSQHHVSANYKNPHANKEVYNCTMKAACCEEEASCCN
jgi:hypothetical protein